MILKDVLYLYSENTTTCILISIFMPSSQGRALTFRLSGDVSRIADDTVLHTHPLKVSLLSPGITHYSRFSFCTNQGCDIAAEVRSKEDIGVFFFSSCMQRCNLLKSSLSPSVHSFNWLK